MQIVEKPRRELPQSLSCPCAVPGECGRHTVIPGRSSNCRPLQRRRHSEPVTEVTGMRISRMKGTETVKKGQSPFLTKGLQSAARTSCPLTADKTYTCSLSCIFCQVQEVNCPEGARETTLECAPTENDQNPFAACGRQTLRGFFDRLRYYVPTRTQNLTCLRAKYGWTSFPCPIQRGDSHASLRTGSECPGNFAKIAGGSRM